MKQNKAKPITLGTVVEESATREASKRNIIVATSLALGIAALMLTTVILPAEYNIDPLGVGQLLGITGLSEPISATVNREEAGFREDEVTFELLPFEFVEYKYQLHQGATVLYSWTASDTVSYDFHGEPEGGPEGFAESFSVGKAVGKNGTFTAPFNGIHGWYWANRGTDTIVVKLTTAGFYSASLEFRDGFIKREAFND